MFVEGDAATCVRLLSSALESLVGVVLRLLQKDRLLVELSALSERFDDGSFASPEDRPRNPNLPYRSWPVPAAGPLVSLLAGLSFVVESLSRPRNLPEIIGVVELGFGAGNGDCCRCTLSEWLFSGVQCECEATESMRGARSRELLRDRKPKRRFGLSTGACPPDT